MSDRRAGDPDETGKEMRRFASQYPHLMIYGLAGLMMVLGSISWTYLKWNSDRITLVEAKTDAQEKANAEAKAQLKVIDERQQRAADDIKETKENVKEIQKDIKELLRQNREHGR